MDGSSNGALAYEPVIHSKRREKWLKARLTGIGASEVAGLMGHGRSPLELWALKTGRLEPDSLEDLEFVHWGNVLEEPILKEYGNAKLPDGSHRYAGRLVRRNGWLVRSNRFHWATATLDGWTLHDKHGLIPLEIKTTNAHNADAWADGAPVQYYWQLQHQMLVTGAPMASIACLIGGQQLVWDDVERNEADIAKIIERGEWFWDLVKRDEPPKEVGGSQSAKKALAAIYPSAIEGKVVQLDRDALDYDIELLTVKKQIKALTDRKNELENQIRSWIGEAEAGALPDGTLYTLKTQRRAEHIVKASEFRVLRRKAS